MRKISIHPVFIAFAFFLVLGGKSLALVNTIVCCTLHELGHIRAAQTRGYRLNRMVFMPYGAMVTGGETIHKKDEAAISLWGPLVNITFFLLLAAFWWIFPDSYQYTRLLAIENLAIALFNLLPLYPLDMSRILLANAKNKPRALKVLRLLGMIASVAFLVLFVLSLVAKTVNFSLLVAALMLLSGSFYGIKSEETMYEYNTAFIKDVRHPVEKKVYRILESLPISRALRLLSASTFLIFEITTAEGKLIATLDEAKLVDRATNAPPGASVGFLVNRTAL